MKLSEVTRIQKNPEKVQEPFDKYLDRIESKEGGRQKEVGSGMYASVYQHPKYKTIVVKVSDQGVGILRYLDFAMRHQDNPYVPKIYGVRRFQKRGGPKYFIAFIERLNDYDRMTNVQKAMILSKHVGPNLVKEFGPVDFFDNVYQDDLVREVSKQRNKKKTVPYLMRVLSYLKRIGGNDLHDGNIMVRGKDQLVFTDPTT